MSTDVRISDSVVNSLKEMQERSDNVFGVPVPFLMGDPWETLAPALSDLLKNTYIITKDGYPLSPTGFKIFSPKPTQIQEFIIEPLKNLYSVNSGRILLETLSKNLTKEAKKLAFSFVFDEKQTPKTLLFEVNLFDPNLLVCQKTSTAVIRLPEILPAYIELPFYSKNEGKIVRFSEPISYIIGHELIHCLQNLTYKRGSFDILAELKAKIPCLKTAEWQDWCEGFFGGESASSWPDELQAMVFGFQIAGAYVSETQLLSELLEKGRCPHELSQYEGDVLIPFGHLGPEEEIKSDDMVRFKKFLSQIENPLFEGMSKKCNIQ